MDAVFDAPRQLVHEAARYWWLFVVSGVAWLFAALIIFRFDYTSVGAIAWLFGILAIVSGANELATAAMADSAGWQVVRVLVGLALIAVGVVAFVHPGNTFVALAAVMGFYFVIKGTFDAVSAVLLRATTPAWWLALLVGIAQVLIGFWAAGSWENSAVVLVAWSGALALMRGITELVVAFGLFEARHATAAAPSSPAAVGR
jgi:uncharacterized membrane protein HdeD (DUF308 family)